MDDKDGESDVRRAWLRWLGVGLAMLAVIAVVLWTQRGPIAENFVNRELNRRGVQASYDLAKIGLRTQRIENLVLGNPDNPDLTARWLEVDIAFAGLTPQVSALRAGGVRMRGSLRNGVLHLGELDKFRDPTSTDPFSLPDIAMALEDARMRFDTDAGAIGLRLDGAGNMRSGFRGKLAAVMPRAAAAGCGLADGSAYLDIAMRGGSPRLSGPLRGSAIACRDMGVAMAKPVIGIDLTLGKALDRWSGRADVRGEALKASTVTLTRLSARIDFDGRADRTAGRLRIQAPSMAGGGAFAQDVALNAAWTIAGAGDVQMQGNIAARNARMRDDDPLAGIRESSIGTPVGPLVARLASAVRDAARDNSLQSRFAFVQRDGGGSVVLTATRFTARSRASAGLAPDSRFTLSWPGVRGAAINWALDGSVTSDGGGLPRAALRLERRAGGGFGGQMFVDPYSAGGARLGLEPIRFTAGPGGETRFATSMRLDGPLQGGGLRGLSLPLDGRIGADGSFALNTRCAPVGFTSLAYGGFTLGRTSLTLCPTDGALLAFGKAGLRGGAEIRKLALTGKNGGSPLRLTADTARVSLGQTGFAFNNLMVSMGARDAPVQFNVASLSGQAVGQALGGRMEGVSGQIGAVPLRIEGAEGKWGYAQGLLKLTGKLNLKDAQQPGRFNPMPSNDFTLTMRDGRIAAHGTLLAPRNGATVLVADIVHNLNNGEGRADLSVPGLVFDNSLQPEDVTPLALGVVANVAATVTGEGHVRWTANNVTSDGLFRTDNANLAAAFGPVEGLSTQIRFTDLIGLVTAPGQVAHLKVVNPGIEVRDGVVRYQLQANQHVHIEGGEFPFAGGRLDLLPTTMDFSADTSRYMTFRVIGLEAGAFIQAMELENISATGTFDGIMPLIFDANGGRIAGGVLVARQAGMPPLLMPEGVLPTIPCDPALQSGTLSYVGPVSNEQLGVFGKLAFDALKNLQYKCLTILMDGALDGEVVTNVVFNGVNRGKLTEAPTSMARNFIGLPFIFNVRIAAPFRGLMGAAQSLIDPSALIRNSLGDDYQQKLKDGVAVQPADSDNGISGEQK